MAHFTKKKKKIKGLIQKGAPDGSALEPNIPNTKVGSATGTNFPLTCHQQESQRNDMLARVCRDTVCV